MVELSEDRRSVVVGVAGAAGSNLGVHASGRSCDSPDSRGPAVEHELVMVMAAADVVDNRNGHEIVIDGSAGSPPDSGTLPLDTPCLRRYDVGMTTTKRKLSLSLDDDLVAALETSTEALSAQVNEAIRHEVARRRREHALQALLGRLDAEAGALDTEEDEREIARFMRLLGGVA